MLNGFVSILNVYGEEKSVFAVKNSFEFFSAVIFGIFGILQGRGVHENLRISLTGELN